MVLISNHDLRHRLSQSYAFPLSQPLSPACLMLQPGLAVVSSRAHGRLKCTTQFQPHRRSALHLHISSAHAFNVPMYSIINIYESPLLYWRPCRASSRLRKTVIPFVTDRLNNLTHGKSAGADPAIIISPAKSTTE